jgi:hypothetical protein
VTRLWVRATLLLALVFLAGVGVGVLVARPRRPTTATGMDPDSAVAALDRRLTLDSTQRTVIRAALKRHQAAVDAAWRQLRPGVAAAIDSTQMEIYSVLRPEQRTAFMELMRRTHPGMPVGTPRMR